MLTHIQTIQRRSKMLKRKRILKGFIFVGMCQANNIFLHKKSVVHFSTVGLAI